MRSEYGPKTPFKDISSSYIKGRISDNENGSVLVGKIADDSVFGVPPWLLAVAVLTTGLPSFGYFMYSFMSMGDHLIPAFLIFIISMGIFVIGFLQLASEGQGEDLVVFLRKVFEKQADSIKIT